MTLASVIIIGAGQGGLQAAISLRQEGFSGAITLIGAEPGLPYQRPPLSKAYLLEGKAEALTLRPESFFRTKDITYLTETRVEGIDRAAGQVIAYGPQGTMRLGYDALVLATGARNLRPPIEGLEHALDLRTLADAARLRAALATKRRIAVIGGGFIGLEFAAMARKLGHGVSVIEAAPRLMARAVSPAISAHFARLHQDWGTELILGHAATRIAPDAVTLANGGTVPADLVLLAAGVRPNSDLAEAAGLVVENGVRVDATLRSSDPAIFALGDCACFLDPRTGAHIRLESVQAATDQARLIAANLVRGTSTAYGALPWFWSDQADIKLQIAGLGGNDCTDILLQDGVVARLRGPDVVAVETLNKPGIHIRARKLLAGNDPVALDQISAIAAPQAAGAA
ncbi:NAD(P)/FAD-dependent oxidoreductase [Natronohydrobacter thiooxidans]|uniref:NAD(P)/FAD-dependent oxidoreductase n=1 Tax=Natronohydrobacter thiooxidans TaxID=87172 RepID=UPI0008FF3BFB|nr:FAD-dependent oxidoreductase [Natronohydrobacter thiooxidans]